MFSSVLLVSVLGLLAYYLWKRKKFTDSLPPGPLSLPLIGNLLQFDRKDPRVSFYKWHKKYGPIYTVWMGMDPYVIISSRELMVEAFVKRGDVFSGRPYNWTNDFFTKGQYGITHNCTDEDWVQQRKFTANILKNFFEKKTFENKIAQQAKELTQQLIRCLGSSKSVTINVKTHLDMCIGNIISTIHVGRTFKPDDQNTFRHLVDNIEETTKLYSSVRMHLLNKFFLLRFAPFFNHFGFDEMSRLNETFLDILISELRALQDDLKEGSPVEPTNLATIYLNELKRKKDAKEERGSFHEWQIISIMCDAWHSGFQPTVATLLWGLLMIIQYPESQQKIQKEIDEIIGKERIAEIADMPNMPFTMAMIHEIQRYANIMPINVPHTVTQDGVVFEGFSIPKDTIVIPQIAVYHMDEKIFKNPQQFQPERFLEADGKTLKKTNLPIPYSLGKRNCLWEEMSRAMLFVVFVSLIQKFSFSVGENEPKPNLVPLKGFVYQPEPFSVRLTLRNTL